MASFCVSPRRQQIRLDDFSRWPRAAVSAPGRGSGPFSRPHLGDAIVDREDVGLKAAEQALQPELEVARGDLVLSTLQLGAATDLADREHAQSRVVLPAGAQRATA
jgi:hypothetical protein